MPRGKARIVAFALVGLTALLVGFQGASTLLTVTQLGASTEKAQLPRAHASLVPQPPVAAIKPVEPGPQAAPIARAGEPVAEEPAKQTPGSSPSAADLTPMPVVTDNQTGIAAAARAKALAEMDAMENAPEQAAPTREQRRRYRAPRPELHKVY